MDATLSNDLMLGFTTREIAILFWLLVAGACSLSNRKIRRSFGRLARSALRRPIVVTVVVMAAWTVGEVAALSWVGLWTMQQLKETLLWFALTAVSGTMAAVTNLDGPNYTRAIAEAFGIVVAIEFVGSMTTFTLPIEVILVFFLGVLGILLGYAQAKSVHQVETVLKSVLGVVGLLILVAAGIRAWQDFSQYANLTAVRSFLVPPALSVLFLPMLFWFALRSRYEWLFAKLRGGWWFSRDPAVRV